MRRRWNSAVGRNLRSCTLHQGLLFPLSLSFSFCCDPFSLSYHGCSLFFLHRSRQRCALALSLTMWNQIALSCQIQLPSVCGCRVSACLCVGYTTVALAKKLSNLKHYRQIFWLFCFCLVFFYYVACKKLSRHVNHPDSCVKPVWWSHRLVILPQAESSTFWTWSQ